MQPWFRHNCPSHFGHSEINIRLYLLVLIQSGRLGFGRHTENEELGGATTAPKYSEKRDPKGQYRIDEDDPPCSHEFCRHAKNISIKK